MPVLFHHSLLTLQCGPCLLIVPGKYDLIVLALNHRDDGVPEVGIHMLWLLLIS